jgi:[ribosomal protein S18]-alanine N-acetyltransferase
VYNKAMRLFRKSFDLRLATSRSLDSADVTAVTRLLRDGARRYYNLSGGMLPDLLEAHQGMALAVGAEIYAFALVGWPVGATCWLRALAFAEGVEVRPALAGLLDGLHPVLAARGLHSVFYAGDENADGWLIPALHERGYQQETEVIVYEKQGLDIPAPGNPDVQVRPATSVDLAEVLSLDQCCFEPQWAKDDPMISDAIRQGPYFMLAERAGRLAGYAYATTHFGGRLVHLVRIAVAPEQRGAGIGVRLLADLVHFAAQQPAYTITLNTQAYNTSAQRIYHWFGFRTTGERQPILRCQLI